MKKVIIIISILGVFLIALFIYNIFPDVKPIYNVIKISSKDECDSIFIKRKVWGMTSDSQIIVISKSSKKFSDPDHQNDYVYGNLPAFFYKQEGNTLFIYSMILSEIPPSFISKINITQVKLTNIEMIGLLKNQKYVFKGLKSIDD